MRPDLNKLLCEHERYGSKNHYGQIRHRKIFKDDRSEEYENLPSRESMTWRYAHDGWDSRKEFGEFLSPLYGFVRKNAGRKWDDVYSELCSVFDMSSVINKHILQHLFQMVEVKTYLDDGVIMYRPYRSASPVLDADGPEYYVDPTSGLLMKNTCALPWKRRYRYRWKEKADPNRVIISDTLEYRKRNDVWFACHISKMPEKDERHYPERIAYDGTVTPARTELIDAKRFDMWEKATITYGGYLAYSWQQRKGAKDSRAINKVGTFVSRVRTASKKEIKKHNLTVVQGTE